MIYHVINCTDTERVINVLNVYCAVSLTHNVFAGHDFSNGLRVEVKASHDFLGSARTVVEFTGVIKKSEAKCYIPSRELCFAATSPEKVTIAVDDAKNTPLMYMLTPLQRFCNTTARYTFSESKCYDPILVSIYSADIIKLTLLLIRFSITKLTVLRLYCASKFDFVILCMKSL